MTSGNSRVPARGAFALSGLIAASHTPLRADGDLNLPLIEKQAALLVKNDISAVFCCGTTGEGMSLTYKHRR